jgi:SAM-dependent methyltransferase
MAVTYTEQNWYDLPRYYDIAFAQLTGRELAFLEAMYDTYAPTRQRRVLEPACGSGRLLAELVRRGYDVTGFDISQPMLDTAAARLRALPRGKRTGTGTLVRASMEGFRSRQRFDFAYCLVNSFRYLLTEDSARRHLAGIGRCLAPGGVYLLGLHLSDYTHGGSERERWIGERGATRVVCTVESQPPDRRSRRETLRSRLLVRENGAVRRYQTQWDFRTYSPRQLQELLASVPALEHIATHDFRYDPDSEVAYGHDELDHILVLCRRG